MSLSTEFLHAEKADGSMEVVRLSSSSPTLPELHSGCRQDYLRSQTVPGVSPITPLALRGKYTPPTISAPTLLGDNLLGQQSPAKPKKVSIGEMDNTYISMSDVNSEGNEPRSLSRGLTVRSCVSEFWKTPRKATPSIIHRHVRPLLAVLVYYLIGLLFYSCYSGWYPLDTIYFSTVLMMTVGYGDQVPHGDVGLVFTACYAMLAVSMIAAAAERLWDSSMVIKLLDYRKQQKQVVKNDLATLSQRELDTKDERRSLAKSVKKQVGKTIRGLLNPSQSVALLDKDAQDKRQRRMKLASLIAFIFWVSLGTWFNAWVQDLPYDAWGGSHLIKGFYFSVITLTTVGFGDFVPRTVGGKLFTIFYILVGVPISVNALGHLIGSIWGEDEESQHVDLVQGLSEKKLKTMLQFQEDMASVGCNNEVDGQVSRFEFMMFVLVRNGIVELDTMETIMRNFDELDVTNTGALELIDLQVRLSRSQGSWQSDVIPP
mmetsp:Transcript_48975/g.77377  ORF Transcript_48975/g.77377 Transcript_48975/m.77377 type:complete len:487 (-) Transcript_48975:81-1541(-)